MVLKYYRTKNSVDRKTYCNTKVDPVLGFLYSSMMIPVWINLSDRQILQEFSIPSHSHRKIVVKFDPGVDNHEEFGVGQGTKKETL